MKLARGFNFHACKNAPPLPQETLPMMDRTKFSIATAFLLASMLAPSNAQAVLVEVTDANSPGGVSNVTHDTDTGMEWLDWTASTSLTFEEITTQMQSGGHFDTWRHATIAEVETLFSNFGTPGPLGSFESTIDFSASYSQAATYLGVTNPVNAANPVKSATSAITADSSLSQERALLASNAHIRVEAGRLGSSLTYTETYSVGDSSEQATFGHALVRQGGIITAVPEPSAFLCVGLIGFGYVSRRRRTR